MHQHTSVGESRQVASAADHGSLVKNQASSLPVQAKLTVGAPDNMYEQEADAVAERVMRMPEPDALTPFTSSPIGVQRKCAHCMEEEKQRLQTKPITPFIQRKGEGGQTASEALTSRINATRGAGSSLSDNTRSFMESRIGADFSGVRVHTGSEAVQMNRELNAQAFTVGRDVYFGEGKYSPESSAGKSLLAHELTHVVQQHLNSDGIIRRRPNPQPFYQEALDEKAKEEKMMARTMSGHPIDILQHLPEIEKIIALAQAVEQEDKKNIQLQTAKVLTIDIYKLSPFFPSDNLMSQIITRIIQLGLAKAAADLTNWQISTNIHHWGSMDEGRKRDQEFYFWDRMVDDLTQLPAPVTLQDSQKRMEGNLVLLKLVRDRLDRIDPKELEEQREIRKSQAESGMLFGFGMSLHDNSILAFNNKMDELFKRLFVSSEVVFQRIIDFAIQELENDKGDATLQLAEDILENRIAPLIDPLMGKDTPAAIAKRKTGFMMEISKSKFVKRGSKHFDYFMEEGQKRPYVNIDFYDANQEIDFLSEMEMPAGQVFETRRKQIHALKRIYGFEKQKSGKLTADAKINSEAISQLRSQNGQLKLHSNEDWRKFALGKYEKHRAAGLDKVKAYDAVIDILQLYLNAFTVHTPYNIDDFGDDQLKKTFPRTLSGQLIHDCGVYALRTAYILSLIREHPELKLQFKFVLLPVHVGLVITGDELPTYIVHNNMFNRFNFKIWEELKDEWTTLDEMGDSRNAKIPLDENQFIGEVAAEGFVPKASMPFKIMDVPHLADKDKKAREALWKFYRHTVVKHNLFKDKSQFHLKYLNILELNKAFHNEVLVPAWNVSLPHIFEKFEKRLTETWQELKDSTPDNEKIRESDFIKTRVEYSDALNSELLDPINAFHQHFSPININLSNLETEVSMELESKHAKIITRNSSIAFTSRTQGLLGSSYWWQDDIFEHMREINNKKSSIPPKAIFEASFKRIEPLAF